MREDEEQRDRLMEIAEKFRYRLTSEEHVEVLSVRNAISGGIRWGKLVENALVILTSTFSTGFFLSGTIVPDWIRHHLAEFGFLAKEEDIIYHNTRGKLRREYITLLLLRKLLGAMQTIIRQRLEQLAPFDAKTEGKLLADLEIMDQAETSDPQNYTDKELLDRMDQLLNGGSQPAELQKFVCSHPGKRKVSQYSVKGKDYTQYSCRSCGEVLSEYLGKEKVWSADGGLTPSGGGCKKHWARWVAGKEGKEAYCTQCDEPLDPTKFIWASAGLEPVGDDPSQDELIVIKARNICA